MNSLWICLLLILSLFLLRSQDSRTLDMINGSHLLISVLKRDKIVIFKSTDMLWSNLFYVMIFRPTECFLKGIANSLSAGTITYQIDFLFQHKIIEICWKLKFSHTQIRSCIEALGRHYEVSRYIHFQAHWILDGFGWYSILYVTNWCFNNASSSCELNNFWVFRCLELFLLFIS